jgi:hypothetical protein
MGELDEDELFTVCLDAIACRFGRVGSTVGGDRHEYWETLHRPRELLKL